jgi:hypothetical protein
VTRSSEGFLCGRSADQIELVRRGDGLRAVPHAERPEDVLRMAADRLRTDEQPFGDLALLQAFREQAERLLWLLVPSLAGGASSNGNTATSDHRP